MTTEENKIMTKEEILKGNLNAIKDNILKIKEEAEEREFKILVKSSKTLEKCLTNIGDNYEKSEKNIDEMNEACNDMFDFMRENKIGKKLKNTIIATILAVYHINQVFKRSTIYIKQYDNGRYEGEMVDGKREGKGKFYFITGDYYEGDFKNNCKEGKGKYIYSANKDIYEGEFKGGKIHGKGKYTYEQGDIYDGEYKNEKRDGLGTYIYSNGNKYIGEWKEGKKHGKGKYCIQYA